ncbi:MAG: double-strand break repair helicase AddA [Rhizobiales bacterium]|nr:double-strand break repair helicase AddA [Hyphomicrobiales bacterium]
MKTLPMLHGVHGRSRRATDTIPMHTSRGSRSGPSRRTMGRPRMPDRRRERLAETTARQGQAADPRASVWVSANAGAGKTHVLTNRVLRLLLSGTAPEKILALTYTKAAAALMSRRVFDTLARWVVMEPAALMRTLADLTGEPVAEGMLERARALFASAIETPGGLKVQTIHAFCERLLQRFPLEAGISPGFEVLDEQGQRLAIREATDRVLGRASREEGGHGPLGAALRVAVAHANDEQFDELLAELLRHRKALSGMAGDGDVEDRARRIDEVVRDVLGLGVGMTDADLVARAAGFLSQTDIERAASALAASSKPTDVKYGVVLAAAAATSALETRIACLEEFFLTKEREPRRSLATAEVKNAHPVLVERLVRAQTAFQVIAGERQALRVATASAALVSLGHEVLRRYEETKVQRGSLDFEDLVVRTGALLASAGDAAWVLYKLDEGLDHILVDEAQDTSPEQWDVVVRLAEEFFSGQGARGDGRTLFAVGDEKQSIYGFQGARPERFSEVGRGIEERARGAGQTFRRVPLTLSFRTVEPVLGAVDRVFGDPEFTPGVGSGGAEDRVRHEAIRIGQAGSVEVWPLEVPEQSEEGNLWDTSAPSPGQGPRERLAKRMARTIRGWIDKGEMLESRGRAIVPGDVLILLRNRQPFAPLIIRALKAEGLAVAGADRIRLLEQIAVMDLLALADFLLLPEDDLSLAAVLKSPLVGLDEEELFEIAYRRRGTLWRSLLGAARHDARFKEAARLLLGWRRQADYAPPFEFLSLVLERDGAKARLIERLGPEASDAIGELLNLAIQFDEGEPPSLQGFLSWLRAANPEIKRDMEDDRSQVRVMTVHGAKGLEAPIVFLPDTCGSLRGTQRARIVSAGNRKRNRALLWALKGVKSVGPVAGRREEMKREEREEENRLLYVAMTRAEDRLVVAGVAKDAKGKVPEGCWYDLVARRLDGLLGAETHADGGVTRVLRQAQTGEPDRRSVGTRQAHERVALPDWVGRAAPAEPRRVIPVAPSRIVPLDAEEAAAGMEAAPDVGQGGVGLDKSLRRGVLMHALLEALPRIEEAGRREAASAYLAAQAGAFSKGECDRMVREVLALIDGAETARLFGPRSRAEVAIVAEHAAHDGAGGTLRLNGQIDRLVVEDEEIVIVDFKTNRMPPLSPDDVPAAYLRQMAAYRLAIEPLFPDRPVTCVIVWTATAGAMMLPAGLIDQHIALIQAQRPKGD